MKTGIFLMFPVSIGKGRAFQVLLYMIKIKYYNYILINYQYFKLYIAQSSSENRCFFKETRCRYVLLLLKVTSSVTVSSRRIVTRYLPFFVPLPSIKKVQMLFTSIGSFGGEIKRGIFLKFCKYVRSLPSVHTQGPWLL